MEIADQYFNNCREIAMRVPELALKKVRYLIFSREGGILTGSNRAVNFIKENTYGPLKITGLKDGQTFAANQPVLCVEGLFSELVTLETTELGFLCYSGATANMKKIVEAADGVPVIDMSARHYPYQIIEEVSLAAYLGGAVGTSTEAGYNYVQKWYNPGENFKLYASLPHAMAAVVVGMAKKENLYPSVMAAKLFQEAFPSSPITVLIDYEGKEIDVIKQAYEVFGEKLFAIRLDTHGGRQMQGTKDSLHSARYYLKTKGVNVGMEGSSKHLSGYGMTVESCFLSRDILNSLGAKNTKIVVSSGFKEEKVKAFRKANAPMDFIGTGSWVKFMMFTADISHVFENGKWKYRTKSGRTHGSIKNHKILFERR